MPRALIFAPHRRSIVSSRPITTGPAAAKQPINKVNKRRAAGDVPAAVEIGVAALLALSR